MARAEADRFLQKTEILDTAALLKDDAESSSLPHTSTNAGITSPNIDNNAGRFGPNTAGISGSNSGSFATEQTTIPGNSNFDNVSFGTGAAVDPINSQASAAGRISGNRSELSGAVTSRSNSDGSALPPISTTDIGTLGRDGATLAGVPANALSRENVVQPTAQGQQIVTTITDPHRPPTVTVIKGQRPWDLRNPDTRVYDQMALAAAARALKDLLGDDKARVFTVHEQTISGHAQTIHGVRELPTTPAAERSLERASVEFGRG